VLQILSKILADSNMFNYIKCFLNSRQFSVSLTNAQSKNYTQQNGIPQGSSLSVTLFLLAINDITNTITFPVKSNLFADDFNFWCKSPNLKTVQHFLQDTANNIAKWSTLTGFKISSLKSQCIIFSNKRGQKHINIQLNDNFIPNVNTIKILGVYFDKKINWLQHLKQLKISLTRSLNIMKMISHTTWGGDEDTLIKVHRHLIRAKIDYGATIYQSAKPHHKKIIDTSINASLRLAIGAFRSSPIESIRNLALEPPSELRHKEKSLLYAASITRNSDNPANKYITEITEYAKDHGIEFNAITKVQPLDFPPWSFNIDINLELTKFKKELTPPMIYKNHLNEILQEHKNANCYYTDASKSEKGVGIAIINQVFSIKHKLPESCSIYTAEAIAILKTVEHILLNHGQGNPHKSNLILSDSLSSLMSLKNPFNTSDIAILILQKISLAYKSGIKISLVWIPGHSDIEGNEKADQEAKKAAEYTDTPILNITSFADIKNQIKELTKIKWQTHWLEQNNKLRKIKNSIFSWPNFLKKRRERVIMNRLRIGHTRLTHGYLMSKDEKPICTTCGTELTVHHILTECRQFSEELHQLNIPTSLDAALGPNSDTTFQILTFLKKFELFNLI